MKKVLLTILASVFILVSCDKDSDVNIYKAGQDLTYFTDVSVDRTIVMTENAPSTYSIKVGSTVSSNVDRTFTISVDPASTAVENVAYTLPSGTVTIPAGEFSADYFVNLDYLGVPNEGASLILNLTGDNVHEPKSTFNITISKLCDSFLAGTHDYVNVTLVSGAGGGCNGSQTATGSVTWTAEGDGLYSTDDASFGQFDTCWGDTGAVGPKFVHLCNSITATDNADQYGDTYTYTIVSCVGNQLVMDWVNTYGDGGRVTITREGGLDWQAELQTN